jgi:hypothetical protein
VQRLGKVWLVRHGAQSRDTRGLGTDEVKSEIVDLRPTQAHFPVHIEQRSYLVSAQDHGQTEMTVNVQFDQNDDRSLTVSAEFFGPSHEIIACSVSRIAYLDAQVLQVRLRPRKVRSTEFTGMPILFSVDDIRCYCAAEWR